MYDLIIIGGGPAGVAAGVYSARKNLKTLILAEGFGGQSFVSPEIQNWIGEINISGSDLAEKLENHLRHYEKNIEIHNNEKVTGIRKEDEIFIIETSKESYQSKTVLITVGASRRKLSVKGADIFEQKGLTYCASCDGPLFAGQDVVVIGGGNAGFGSAGQLLAYCKSVTLLESNPSFKAEQITVDRLTQKPNFKAFNNIEIIEIKGEKFVNKIIYRDRTNNEIIELPVTGIFVEIGFIPNTDIFKNLLETNQMGAIVINHQTQRTSVEGIWSAGDCTDVLYHQNNIAVGDAIKAVEDIFYYLQNK